MQSSSLAISVKWFYFRTEYFKRKSIMSYRQLNKAKLGRSLLRLIAIAFVMMVVASVPVLARDNASAAFVNKKPTIVLVHGAWADPSGWNRVAALLQLTGYETSTPTLDLLSIEGDVATVRATLDNIPGKKILVAHSYGGIVISNAAYGRSDVLGLVYSAAFVPDAGDSIISLGQGFVQSEAFNHLIFTGAPFASPAYIDPAFFTQYFAQDLIKLVAAKLNAAQRPINAPILFTPSGPVAWHTLPSWYAVSGSDLIIDPAEQRWMASRAGATTITFNSASHIGGIVKHAIAFTALIELAARVTTR
jgi:pimeloyl-ACP methyl ester carboxylesterase